MQTLTACNRFHLSHLIMNQQREPMYQNKVYALKQLLDMAETGQIAIPNIQRPFVWTPAQLARYVDSLMHGWPCGTLLLWNTDNDNQKIFGTRNFAFLHSTQDIADQEVENKGYSYLILDGQQRMQSLVLGFSSHSQGYEATLHEWSRDAGQTSGNRNVTARKLLCFNLKNWTPELTATMPSFFYLDYEEDELEDTPCLQWKTEDEISSSGGLLVPICRMPAYCRTESAALSWLRGVVDFILNDTQFPVLEVNRIDHEVQNMDDDEAIVQIFTRLNTAGTPLTKEQIQAARINSLWDRFQEKIDNLKDLLSQKRFGLSLSDDDLINGYNIVLRVWYGKTDISKVYQEVSARQEWEIVWQLFEHYTKECIIALHEKDLVFNSEYKSLYILWFPVAHLCRADGNGKAGRIEISKNLALTLVKWTLVTTWAKIWANRSGQYVKGFTRRLIDESANDSTESWLSGILHGEKKDANLIKMACDNISNLAANHRNNVRQYYLPLWVWTRLNEDRAKYVFSFGKDLFAVDHIFPIARVTDVNLQTTYNSLGNCWMLCSDANSKKSDDLFPDFLENYGMRQKEQEAAGYLEFASDELLLATQASEQYSEIIRIREARIKDSLIQYIGSHDIDLAFPSQEEIERRTYHHNTNGIYRGDEYVATEFFKGLGFKSQQSYLSNIRTGLEDLGVTDVSNAENLQKLNQAIEYGDSGNKKTALRSYYNFLIGKITSPRKNTGTRQANKKAKQPRVRDNAAGNQNVGNGAVAKLRKVIKKPEQLNYILINKAIGAGCTDVNPISWDQLKIKLGPKKGSGTWDATLTSCSTDGGNSYGHYFDKSGDNITFAPEVWAELKRLSWDKEL